MEKQLPNMKTDRHLHENWTPNTQDSWSRQELICMRVRACRNGLIVICRFVVGKIILQVMFRGNPFITWYM